MCHVKGAEFGKAQVLFFIYLERVVMACSAGAWGMGLHAAPISSVLVLGKLHIHVIGFHIGKIWYVYN